MCTHAPHHNIQQVADNLPNYPAPPGLGLRWAIEGSYRKHSRTMVVMCRPVGGYNGMDRELGLGFLILKCETPESALTLRSTVGE